MKILQFIIFILFLLVFTSCNGKKRVIKKKKKERAPIVINYDKFPQKNLLLRDTRFIGYIDPKLFLKTELFKTQYKMIEKIVPKLAMKHLGAFNSFYFTLSDYQKREELLLFFDYKLDFLLKDSFEKRVIEKDEIIIFSKTNNQEFGYLKVKDHSIYGDISLIDELYRVADKKIESISNERYDKFISNIDNLNNSIIKIIWLPLKDDIKLLEKIAKKQPIFKEFLINLKEFSLDIKLIKNRLSFFIKIESSKSGIGQIYNLLAKEVVLLRTKLDNKELNMENDKIVIIEDFFNFLEIKEKKNILTLKFSLEDKLINKFISISQGD